MFSLRTRLRAYLGTDPNPALEATMTTFLTLLTGLAEQQQAASAAQQASFLNLHNAVDKLTQSITDLQTAVANGDVSDEVQAAATAISENLTTMKKAAETADDGFEPVEVPTEPTDPGTGVPVDGQPVVTDPIDGTPVDETPTVPVEDVPAENARKR
ncbi:hypothetical protein ACWKSP_26460 [Micromonosporaceae bacterium Da 78-11]